MKLLFCKACHVVESLPTVGVWAVCNGCRTSLRPEAEVSKGRYLFDGLHAEVSGPNAAMLGIDNRDVARLALLKGPWEARVWLIEPDQEGTHVTRVR